MDRGSHTATESLTAFAAALTPERLTDPVMKLTGALILDAVGCSLAGWLADETPSVETSLRHLGDEGSSTVIGSDRPSSLLAAVAMNGYLITGITACDVYVPAHLHLTPEIVPVALALAESNHATGCQLLVAVAAGMEVAARLGKSLDYHEFRRRGWHAPGVIGPIGGAVTAAKLLDLDQAGTRRAMALAYSQASGTHASWPTAAVKFHQSRGAMAGLLSGLLAKEGLEASSDPISAADGGLFSSYGPGDVAAIETDLGDQWEMLNISLRPWPGAMPVQALLTALLTNPQIQEVNHIDVERIQMYVPASTYAAHSKLTRPNGIFEALLSFHFVAAATLRAGRFWTDLATPSSLTDPDLLRFIDERVLLAQDDTVPIGGVRVKLETRDGRELIVEQDHALGTPQLPATSATLTAKFRTCSGVRLGETLGEELLQRLLDLDSIADCAELLPLTRPVE